MNNNGQSLNIMMVDIMKNEDVSFLNLLDGLVILSSSIRPLYQQSIRAVCDVVEQLQSDFIKLKRRGKE